MCWDTNRGYKLNDALFSIRYIDVVTDGVNNYDFFVEVHPSLEGYKSSDGEKWKMDYIKVFEFANDGFWLEVYPHSTDNKNNSDPTNSFNIFHIVGEKGHADYGVTMCILDKNNCAVKGNFIFSMHDVDIKSKSGSYDVSEGIELWKGLYVDTIRVTRKSKLKGRFTNGILDRVIGAEDDSISTESNAATFVALSNSRGISFQWTAGQKCGTKFCAKNTTGPNFKPMPLEITVKGFVRDYENGLAIPVGTNNTGEIFNKKVIPDGNKKYYNFSDYGNPIINAGYMYMNKWTTNYDTTTYGVYPGESIPGTGNSAEVDTTKGKNSVTVYDCIKDCYVNVYDRAEDGQFNYRRTWDEKIIKGTSKSYSPRNDLGVGYEYKRYVLERTKLNVSPTGVISYETLPVITGKQSKLEEKSLEETIKLDYEQGVRYTLIFYYDRAVLLLPNPENPKEGYVQNHGDSYFYPDTCSNQLINRNSSTKYWVLDEKGNLYLKFGITNNGQGVYVPTVALTFPFDGYRLKSDGTYDSIKNGVEYFISVDSINKPEDNKNEGENLWWKVEIGKIIPVVSVPDGNSYNISARINVNYNNASFNNGMRNITREGVTKTSVTIVGTLYDFSVTNIDGSATTGDQIWKASLFTNPVLQTISARKEYEADLLPIGQSTQQNKAYVYGINKGTRLYYSINTKGSASDKIQITPRFYVVNSNGKQRAEVKVVDAKNQEINYSRTISLTDTNRITDEYRKEVAKKGSATNSANITANGKIMTLDTSVRFPYVNYGTTDKERYDEISNINEVGSGAYHWYGEFSIPSKAKYLAKNAEGKEVEVKGTLLVEFSIKTLREDGSEYLAYGLNSPFINSKADESEWKYERVYFARKNNQKYTSEYNLPRTDAKVDKGNAVNGWSNIDLNKEVYVPVALYGTQSAKMDSSGTH